MNNIKNKEIFRFTIELITSENDIQGAYYGQELKIKNIFDCEEEVRLIMKNEQELGLFLEIIQKAVTYFREEGYTSYEVSINKRD